MQDYRINGKLRTPLPEGEGSRRGALASDCRPILGSLILHLAAVGVFFSVAVATTPPAQSSLPKAMTVSIAYIQPSAEPIPELVKPKIKSKGRNLKKKQVVKEAQKPTAETKNTAAAASNSEANSQLLKQENYTATLLAWLEQHKHYPRQARIARMEGDAILYFKIDREGKVLDYQLVQSTGHYVLDDAVITMITSASPVPTPPSQLSIAELNFTVPVAFTFN